MTRAEHLRWCKDRALEYARMGQPQEAMTSMFSDLGKHPETEGHLGIELGMMMLLAGLLDTGAKAAKFIEGFN